MYVVSSLFDLARREGTPRQNIADYVRLGRPLLERLTQDHDVIVFVEPELEDAVRDAGRGSRRLQLVPCRLEDMPAYEDLAEIERARIRHPLRGPGGPIRNVKDTPLYNVFQRTKIHLLERAIDLAPVATHVAWVDFGVGKISPVEDIPPALDAAAKLDRVQLCHHYDLEDRGEANDDPRAYLELRQNVAAGFIAGPVAKIRAFAAEFDHQMRAWLDAGVAPHDETALEAIACHSELVVGRRIRHHSTMFRDCVTVEGAGLLGLVMIVKNEAHNIEQTLASFGPIVDRWTILDTGSTDGTQNVIRRVLAGVPGELHEEPFVDFSTSRNRALELHGRSTTFAVMPDSDDFLVDAPLLRSFCEARRGAVGISEEAYGLNIRRGQLSYYLPLVMRTSAGWRYSGRVHECCGRPGGLPASVRVPGVQLCQHPKPQSAEASRARWSRDLELLKADKEANPTDSRTSFYLAQTYECLGKPEAALLEYEHRIRLGGWSEETFEAKLRRAKILAVVKQWPEAEAAFLDVHQFDPKRAEPLFHIANHYYGLDQHALVYLFASRALALPMPKTMLFVDAEVYEWKAADLVAISGFYLGKQLGDTQVLAAGERAADLAVKGSPNNDRLRNNRAFYARSASEMFKDGYLGREISWKPELPYRAMNPSVWFDGERWRCIVRTVNYHIVNGQYLTPDDNVIYTRNWMLELAPQSLAVERAVEMVDRDPTPRSSFPVHGFEDCRLFSRGQRLYATSTACDLNDERGNREIVLLELDDDYSIRKATPLRGPWSLHHQKNWMPLVDGEHVRFIYSTVPEVVLDGIPRTSAPAGLTHYSYGRLRGGSQAVRVSEGVLETEGWLFIVHDVVWNGGARVYLHRWVLMNDALKVTKMSDPFYFKRRGIEFCAGLGYDDDSGRLVASFSVNDESAHLGVFDVDSVMDSLRSDFVI